MPRQIWLSVRKKLPNKFENFAIREHVRVTCYSIQISVLMRKNADLNRSMTATLSNYYQEPVTAQDEDP